MLVGAVHKILYSIWKASWLIAYSLAISTVVFTCFYLLYLPPAQHKKPVYFQVSSDCERKLSDGYCSFPEASVMLHDSSKAAQDGLRVLTRGQAYDISLELELPLSMPNKELGMFMAQIDLMGKEGKLIESSTRMAMVSYKSYLLITISTFVNIVPLLLGFKEEKQHISVNLYENFMENSYQPAANAKITLHSKFIQVYSANLKICAVFTGLRYYMYNWPMTFSLLSFAFIFMIVTLFCLWRTVKNSVVNVRTHSPNYGNLSDSDSGDSVEDLETFEEEEQNNEHIPSSTNEESGHCIRRRLKPTERGNDTDTITEKLPSQSEAE